MLTSRQLVYVYGLNCIADMAYANSLRQAVYPVWYPV